MLGAQVTTCYICPATVESHALYLPVFMVLHILHTFTNWQWIFTGATHITYKNQNTLHTSKSTTVPADHPYLI